MTRAQYFWGAFLTAVLVIVGLAGCGAFGESHNYNAAAPYANVKLKWVRLESPGNYHTIIHACYRGNGLYLTQADNNSITVVPNDPICAIHLQPSPAANVSAVG